MESVVRTIEGYAIGYPGEIPRTWNGPEEAFDIVGKHTGTIYECFVLPKGDDFATARGIDNRYGIIRGCVNEPLGVEVAPRE